MSTEESKPLAAKVHTEVIKLENTENTENNDIDNDGSNDNNNKNSKENFLPLDENDILSHQKSIEKFKESGNAHFKNHEFHVAIEEYDKGTNLYDKYASFRETYLKEHFKSWSALENVVGAICNNRAFCYFKIELYGAAVTDSTQAIKLKFWKGYYRRGCSNAALGKWSKAKNDFSKAKEKFPKDQDIESKFKQADAAFRQQKFFDAIKTEAGQPPSLGIKLSDFGEIDDTYKGPRLPTDSKDLNINFIKKLHEWQKDGNKLHARYVVEIILRSIELFKKLPNIVTYDVPDDEKDGHITVCGDIHGQYYDYLNIFELNGLPSTTNPYLFNGDFVDRGSWSCEVIISMLACKLTFPNHFHLTRGNHETLNMNAMYGFKGEVEHKFSKIVFELFTELFNLLPLACIINKSVFVCHGGLFKQPHVKLEDLLKIDRNQQPSDEVMNDLLWSDPQEARGLAPSKRGGGTMFGPDITEMFLKDNNLSLVIRSHEVQEEGYKVHHNGKLVTIFSAPNYIDSMGNKGAFIKLDKNSKPHYTQFSAVSHPDVKPMAYAGGPMGFMNFN